MSKWSQVLGLPLRQKMYDQTKIFISAAPPKYHIKSKPERRAKRGEKILRFGTLDHESRR